MTDAYELGSARRLSSAVTQALRDLILSGGLRDGERLVMQDLAERFDTSRGPVRDALRQLEEEGLVVPLPRRGVRVASLTPEDAEEIIAVRQALEPVALRFAMKRDQAELVSRLEAKVQEIRKSASSGDWSAAVVSDMGFHGLLYQLSGRRRIQRIWESMQVPILHTFRLHRRFYSAIEDLVAEHEDLLDIVRTGNVRAAERAFHQHPGGFLDELLPMLERDALLRQAPGDEPAPGWPGEPSLEPGNPRRQGK